MCKKIDPHGAVFLSMTLLLTLCLCMLLPRDVQAMSRQFLSTPEQAEAFVGMLLGENADSLEGMYELTPDMEQAVTASGGWSGLAKSRSALGDPVSIGPAYADVWKGRDVLRVPCIFSMAKADLVFVLEKGAIGGLVTDYYTGAQEAPAEEALVEEPLPEEPSEEDHFTELSLSVPVPQLEAGLQGGQPEELQNGHQGGLQEEVSEASDEAPIELPGTLTIPEGEGPFPVVVLVHGSGPNNRDEEIMSLKPFKDLAEGLAQKGIAVYRYDKRTYVYGQELAGDCQITLMEETVEDAAAAVQVVAGQEKIDPSRIFVLGHSLGAMAVPAIREQLEKEDRPVAGFILMAPAARPLDVLMREQVEYLYSLQPEVTDDQLKEKEALFEELDRLEHLDELPDETSIAGAYVPYWRWLRAYDAVAEAGKITEPCLLLQGEEDYQVTMEDFRMWQEAFGNRQGWKLISYPGLVHTFTEGTKEEGSAAYTRDAHVDAQVIEDIAEFVNVEEVPGTEASTEEATEGVTEEATEESLTEEAPSQESTDLFTQTRSFEINRTFEIGNISLEVISVMIGGSAWIEENGTENPGYTIDVYYHVRPKENLAKETDENEPIAYELGQGRLIVENEEYVLQNVIRSIEEELSGRNTTAEPGDEWRTYCRSYCLMEKGPEGKRTLTSLQADTPMELQFSLTDKTDGTASAFLLALNGESHP